MRIRKIAEEHGIPSRFLVQILLQLKGAGLVISTRGAVGRLSTGQAAGANFAGRSDERHRRARRGSHDQRRPRLGRGQGAGIGLARSRRRARKMLETITFDQLVDRARHQAENMYYI